MFAAFAEVVQTRRSVRQWVDEPVPRADLERMVECARLAPSDTNSQPWHFTIVTDRAHIVALEQATRDRFAALSRRLDESGQRETARKLRVFERYAAHFWSAPAVVLVSGEPYDSRFMREIFSRLFPPAGLQQLAQEESIKSTALASMNLLLAAHALGYGAVPMTGPVLVIPETLKERLGVRPPFEPHLLIAIGRPARDQLAPVPRKAMAEVSTWIG